MGLKMRITHNEKDYIYEIDSYAIKNATTEISVILDGRSIVLKKNESKAWMLNGDENLIEPGFGHALGRSISLRYRL